MEHHERIRVREVWIDIPGFPGYEVSSFGRVRSWKRSRPIILAQMICCEGYAKLSLSRNGHTTQHRVNRLVLESFVGPCPEGYQSSHENGVRSDNRLSNLSWKTPLENMADKQRHGTQCRGRHKVAPSLPRASFVI